MELGSDLFRTELQGAQTYKILARDPIGLPVQGVFSTSATRAPRRARTCAHNGLHAKAWLARQRSIDLSQRRS